ncbi:MAG: LacI family DNA-binding transcriptional regulator [Bacteroidota bacterium]
MNVTIKHIADALGITPSAVSKALNDYPDVSAELKERVRTTAQALNYQPNGMARGLVKGRSRTIGLFILGHRRTGGFAHPFTVEVMAGIMDGAAEQGYDLVLFSADGRLLAEAYCNELARRRRVEAMILLGVQADDPGLATLGVEGPPSVILDVPVAGKNVSYVAGNSERGGELAADHLLRLGHRRLLMINGHRHAAVSYARERGFTRVCAAAGITPRIIEGDFTEEGGHRCMNEALEGGARPTGIFLASDLMAFGALRALQGRGLEIPRDVSVVGYDDIAPAAHITPPLTTIRQDRYLYGRKLADCALALITAGTCAPQLVEPTLVVRASTDRCKEE